MDEGTGWVVSQVTNGGAGMPAFKDTLTTQQIKDVAAYVTERIAESPQCVDFPIR